MYRHLNVRVDYTDCNYKDLNIDLQDGEVLRNLSLLVKELAETPLMAEKKRLWNLHNNLEGERPMILCDPENGWHEIIPEKNLLCRNDIARHWELTLRKQIFWGNTMGDDYAFEPVFDVSHVYSEKPWRIKGKEELSHGFTTQLDGGAYHINSIMESYDELESVLSPEITVDFETSEKIINLADDVFGNILKVQNRTVWFWSFGLTDEFSQLRGMDNMMFDFFDNPDGVHSLMNRLKIGTMDRLHFLEKEGLLSPNNDYSYTGSGGQGYTDTLSAAKPAKLAETWGLSESQITVGVSPDMFKEFIFPYQREIMETFGLTCYGCCEGLQDRFDTVKTASNLRRVSVSHWADAQKMSDLLQKKYIYSLKPSPTPLSFSHMDKDASKRELESKFAITRDKNCVEIIMKDNHTLGGNPSNVTDWVSLARETIGI